MRKCIHIIRSRESSDLTLLAPCQNSIHLHYYLVESTSAASTARHANPSKCLLLESRPPFQRLGRIFSFGLRSEPAGSRTPGSSKSSLRHMKSTIVPLLTLPSVSEFVPPHGRDRRMVSLCPSLRSRMGRCGDHCSNQYNDTADSIFDVAGGLQARWIASLGHGLSG